MSAMHMSQLDKVRQLRYEGYTVGMLALEIDLLREGRGTSSMSNAVDALATVATALRDADDTLRTELGKLGIEWRGEASSIAQSVMLTSADFAEDATDKINESSQVAYGLSEAFQRALNTLPDSRTLRDGADGLSTMDVLADLIGHETDHAAKVRAASAARDQAVDALNQLASSCAEELASIRRLSEPGAIVLDHGQAPPEQAGDGAEAGYQTMAAVAESVSGPDARPGGVPTAPVSAGPPDNAPPPNSGANTTTGGKPSGGSRPGSPSEGGGRPPSGGGQPPSGGSEPGPVGGVTDPLPGSGEGRSGPQASTADGSGGGSGGALHTGGSGGTTTVGGGAAPGGAAAPGGGATAPGGGAGASVADSGGASRGDAGVTDSGGTGLSSVTTAPGAPVGTPPLVSGGVTADLLATGKVTGAVQSQTQATAGTHGNGVTAATPVTDEDGIAGAAIATGAAGIAGAMSAEPDRERRPTKYGVTDDADETFRHEFDVGVLDDEAEADAVAEIEPDAGQDDPAYLEHAAPHGDARVRTHGIDDADLFADDRMVARDTIGDDPSDSYHDDRQDRS